MADSGIFRINPLQSWQREAILKAAQLLRDRFGNPPVDAQARSAHDGLLEVLDPARRTVRLQKELMVRWRNTDLASAIRFGINAFAQNYATGEGREAALAFLEKRPPKFE